MNEIVFNKPKFKEKEPIFLNFNSRKISNQQECAETFNNFFINISSSIRISQNSNINFSNNFENYMVSKADNNFNFKPVSLADILKSIDSLNGSAANGEDGISCKFIKKCKPLISLKLQELINNCLSENFFPISLKKSKVIVLHKSDNKENITNYRPISLLPSFSKILERIIHTQIYVHLESNNLLSPNQFGFLPKSSTTSAILSLIHFITNSLDNKKFTSCIFIDLQKAFDTVCHSILVSKLKFLGFSPDAQALINSFLSDRKQTVHLKEFKSSCKNILTGCPQGSILSPLLFLIFVDDIFNLSLKGSIQMYADDIAIKYSASSKSELESFMQSDLNQLKQWFDENNLFMNIKKTNFMMFSLVGPPETLNVFVENNKIIQVSNTKFLGLVLDSNLNWKSHVNQLKSKLLPLFFAFRKSRKFMSYKTALSFYYAHFYSHFIHMIPIWGYARSNVLQPLRILQNGIIKTLKNLPYLYPTSRIYDKDLLPIDSIVHYETLYLIFRIKNNMLKSNDILPIVSDFHPYRTRQVNNFHLSFRNTRIGQYNIFYHGLREFNNLPISLKNETNVNRFRKSLKQLIFDRNLINNVIVNL